MKLTIVIVNYKVKDLLLQCLDCIRRSRIPFDCETVVVDNDSDDGSCEAVARLFPEVRYISLTENAGFAKANNLAIRQSQADYVLLLNPDTILPEDLLQSVVSFADKADNLGALGVKMLDTQGRFLPESKRNVPTLWNAFLKMSGLGRLTGCNPYYCQRVGADEVGCVPVLAGAFMLLNRKALGDVCLLDEDFFMFGEDIDLSVRIREAGRDNYYVPFEMLHYKGESTCQNYKRYISDFYTAMRVYYRKHAVSGGGFVTLCTRLLERLHLAVAGLQPKPQPDEPLLLDASRLTYSDILNEVKTQGRGRSLRILHPDLQIEIPC